MTFCSLCLFIVSMVGDGVSSEFIPSGITRKVGGYRPERAEMDKDASSVNKVPDGLADPKFGEIKIGEKTWSFVLDEPEDGDAKLFVDTNNDKDLTNDPETKWEAKTSGKQTMYSGEATIDLGEGQIGTIGLYRFDPKDERRAALKNTVLYYTDYGFEYTLTLDDKEFKTSVSGSPSPTQNLWIDRDDNGQPSRTYEMAKIGEPFNFTGTTYVLKLDAGKLSLDKADKAIDQLPLPPDLTIGKQALSFEATTMDGNTVSFPKSFAGKIVMLDFWATWCGPCIGEIPHMKQAYADWHDKGFEILGVSFDFPDTEEKVKTFLEEKELPWAQIYEGKGWETSLGLKHDVSGIPFVLLVDGDTGKILATAQQLRGEGLSEFVGKALEEKGVKVSKPGGKTPEETGKKASEPIVD